MAAVSRASVSVFVIPAKAFDDPSLTLTYYSRSSTDLIVQERLGRVDDALARYREALSLDPAGQSRYLETLGILYIRQGEYAKAAEVLEFALANDPKDDRRHSYSLSFYVDLARKRRDEKGPGDTGGEGATPHFLASEMGRWRTRQRQAAFLLPSVLVHAALLLLVGFLSTHELRFHKEVKEDFTYVDVGPGAEPVPAEVLTHLLQSASASLRTLGLRAHQKGLELACRIAPRVPERVVGDLEDDFAVVLLRGDGDILVRYPEFTVGQKLDLTELRRDAGAAHQLRYMRSPVDNLSRLYASGKIGTFPAYITFSLAQGAIIREWTRNLALPTGVGIVITAVLMLLTLFALRRAQREGFAIQQLKDVAQSLNEEIQRRQKAESSLLQAQKLDALGRITSGIAHDFNNLLMIISGSLGLAKKQQAGPALRRLLKACEQATERGAALIRQLLAFSRGQTLRPVAIDVRRVLADGQAWIGRVVTEAVQIDIACDDDVWPVFADLTQLESALLNLVVNARDAMPGGGRLTIKVRNVTFAEKQATRPLFGDYVAIAVSDSGCGMSEEVLGKVFEPFFTTKGIGKGTGLGLSQIHGFIQQSGGDISIVSEVGKGTTVTLYLPRSKEKPSPEQTSLQPAASLPLQNEDVVLVVEDDDAVRKTIVEQLYDLAYRPIAVRSVEEARGILSASGRLDILLTDYTLAGGSNGMELAREAKKRRPELRTLIMTASLDVEKLSGTPLRKPFTQAELQRALAGLPS